MLDINFVRANPEAVKNDLRKRGWDEKLQLVDNLLKYDKQWKELKGEVDEFRHQRNVLSEKINEFAKAKKDVSHLVKEAKALPEAIKDAEERLNSLKTEIDFILMRLPNILHHSVPVGKDDTENKVERTWGKQRQFDFELKPHGELAQEILGIADFERAAKISGNGFYFLKGDLALLNQALIRFAIDNLNKKGYIFVEPPYLMHRKPYEGVTDLEDFETMMYKIENEDLYLIATSEHPMAAMYMDEAIPEEELPIKFVGLSPCFRKEIGSHGVDTKGLFRVHQFHKIEQFIFCRPEDSWDYHEELIKNAEEIFQKLELPYRVVSICTGDIGTVASKKYDIEVWMPREEKYREVVSCSNCTSYQAVRLNIKYSNKDGKKEYLHTLNSTAIATGRAMRAILENYQNNDGSVIIPKVLIPYFGKDKIEKRK